MRWLLSFLFISLLSLVQALSSSGSRMLIAIEDTAEKEKYSAFWEDLEGTLLTLLQIPPPIAKDPQDEATSFLSSLRRMKNSHYSS